MANRKITTRSDYDFWVTIKSRWADMDGLRHINNAAYLSYMETARLDFYHHLGFEYTRWDAEISTIIASMTIDYLEQGYYPSTYEVGQSITRVGNTSFDILTAVFVEGEETPVVQGNFTIVAFNFKKNKPISVPKVFRDWIRHD